MLFALIVKEDFCPYCVLLVNSIILNTDHCREITFHRFLVSKA